MNTKLFNIVVAVATIMLMMVSVTLFAKNMPDFNFPKTVISEADMQLDQAIKQHNGPDVVKYLIQSTIAEAQISSDNIPKILTKIDSVNALVADDATRATLHYLKAVVYDSYYHNNWYEISRRAAVDTRADDISEWTGDDFTAVITDCLQQALSYSDALYATPVNRYTDADKYSVVVYPTMLDMVTYNGVSMLRNNYDGSIQNSPTKKRAETLAEEAMAALMQRHKNDAAPYITAKLDATNHAERKQVAQELFEQFKGDQYSYLALEAYLDEIDDDKEKYDLLNDYLKRFPDGTLSPNARNALAAVTQKSVMLIYDNSFTTADSIKVSVEAKNVNSCQVRIYRVPDGTAVNSKLLKSGLQNLQLLASATATLQGTVPFTDTVELSMPPLTYGRYIVVPEYDGSLKKNNVYPEEFRVTDITLFSTRLKDGAKVFAVDARTGKPIEGVYINRTNNLDLPQTARVKANRTNAEGYCLIDNDDKRMNERVAAIKGDDRYGMGLYVSDLYYSYERQIENIEVLTDLGVYRPGDTVQYAAICYNLGRSSRQVIANMPVRVIFYDSNYREIVTDSLVTDEMGRVQGQFVIPTDRMNGRFSIEVVSSDARGRGAVIVSEYKTPTFYVEFDGEQQSYARGADVSLTGRAAYFTGVPVANAAVDLSLGYQEWNWWYRSGGYTTHIKDFNVTTDADGRFTITIDSAHLPEVKSWRLRQFVLKASVTDAAGETQNTDKIFWLGTAHSIESTNSDFTFEVSGGTVQLPLKVFSSDPADTLLTCNYSLSGIAQKSGTFVSNNPVIDVASLPSGSYELKVWLNDDVKFETPVELFRVGDALPPVESPMWIPQCQAKVNENNEVSVLIGNTTPEAYIYCIAASKKGVIKEAWLRYEKGMHTFKIDIPKEEDEYIDLTLITVSERKIEQWSRRFNSVVNVRKLAIKTVAFRDLLTPGAPETWSFQLTDQDGDPWRGAMICDMYDKALDMIEQHYWGFNPQWNGNKLYGTYFNWLRDIHLRTHLPWQAEKIENLNLPNLNFYGRTYGGYLRVRGSSRNMLHSSMAAPVVECFDMVSVEEIAMPKEESVMEDVEAEAGAMAGAGFDAEALEKVQLRAADIQNALWQPSLTTDADGNVSITFDSPQFNTTWLFKAIAYTTDLHTASMVQEVVTRKPIMVRASLPRFVRNGDKAQLSSMLMNVTDSMQHCSAIVEIFDINTGEVIKSQPFTVSLEANSSASLDIMWEVPADMSMIGYRVKAATDEFGDGEQRLLPVLPSVSPIIETAPFYLTNDNTFDLSIEGKKDSRMVLEYCNNPVWYCVMALPSIKQDDYLTASALSHSLYAVAVAQGVANSNPEIKNAIDTWLNNESDSTLVSNLSKNADLKIGTLLASPWINEADRQTMRMQSVGELFDSVAVASEMEKIIGKLRELQMSDGGWTWFKYNGCRSSQYVTMQVLQLIGELRHLGYLSDNVDIDAMSRKAVAYLDKETVNDYNNMKDKHALSVFYDYAYVRSLFDYGFASSSQDVFKKTLNYMKKNWDEATGLSDKAYCAMTLYRNGEKNTAREIMESVRQYGIMSQNGMYWDNFKNGSDRGFGKVAVTSTLLQAFAEVSNDTPTIDAIRQWVLLQKQATDWGNYSMAADAVNAILSTGTQWLGEQPAPAITLNGKPIEYEPTDLYLGYFRKQLTGSEDLKLSIDRSGAVSPAWGAVYCQYKAKMTEVEAVKIDDLSIEKQVCKLDGGKLNSKATLAVGDKVLMRLVIKNTRDLQFVTLHDERAACCEPVDQTSGYRYADGVGYYHETKDSATRLFFNYLPKGTHIITYEVTVTSPGSYNTGVATVQSLYAPQITAHSAGGMLNIQGL